MKVTLRALQPTYLPADRPSQLWNTTLTWDPAQVWEVVAPSGTGKSTLVRLLYGLEQRYQGAYLLDETDTAHLRPAGWQQVRRTRIACVFQGLELFPQLTVHENLHLKARLAPGFVTQAQMKGYLEALDMAPFWNRPLHTLSFGQAQRVAIVRALVQPAQLLLLDEPFSHLDPDNQARAWQLIREVAQARQAGIIITSLTPQPQLNATHVYHL